MGSRGTFHAPAKIFSQRELDLIRRTVAKDCNVPEFDLFINICKNTGLDPLRRQIYAFVFHKDDASKRQLVPVVAISGLRAMADRIGTYRPNPQTPRFTFDEAAKNAGSNPLGIVKAEVTLYKYAQGEWFPVAGEAYWDEYVPLYNGKIDSKKQGWVKMPRIMLPKCAEAMALRKGWPDDFSNLYEETELDRAQVLDLTPTELADIGGIDRRMDLIGGPNTIMFDFLVDNAPIERVPHEKVAERIEEFVATHNQNDIRKFQERNRHAMQEFWALRGSEALAIKQLIERKAECSD